MSGFEDFFRSEYASVRRALVVALGDVAAAEEAAQYGFAEAFVQWKRVSGMERPAGWVYVAAVRYAWRQRPIFDVAPRPVRDHAEDVAANQQIEVLLAALPPRQRLAVVLRYLVDLPLEQVAEAMGCAVGTAKSTLHAALVRLRVDATKGLEVADDAC